MNPRLHRSPRIPGPTAAWAACLTLAAGLAACSGSGTPLPGADAALQEDAGFVALDAGPPGADAAFAPPDAESSGNADASAADGAPLPNDSGVQSHDSGVPTPPDAAMPSPDSGVVLVPDSGVPPPPDAGFADAAAPADTGVVDPGDGTPTRQQCTGNFGGALDTSFGRLDGFLVSVIAPGGPRSCNSDSGHVHFQVLMQGSIYDVAVNLDTLELAEDVALPDGAWSEGWHTGLHLDYPSIGLHSNAFSTPADSTTAVMNFVADANHVAIYATGYGATGAHDVHRRGSGHDGAIFIDPLSPTPHALFFCFSTDSF
jgi:hypothetical protein